MIRTHLSITLAALCAFSLAAFAAEKKHGKEITLKETTKISTILAGPEAFSGKEVLVEGTIVDVCKKRGCWIKIAEEGAASPIMFKVTDGVMVFPVESKGSKVKAQGTVAVAKKSAEAGHEHGATCKGCGDVSVMIKGDGAVVFDAEPAKAQ